MAVHDTLTLRQINIVSTIRNFIHLHGYSPSINEVAQLAGCARGTAMDHIQTLERKGVLKSQPRTPRSIVLLSPT